MSITSILFLFIFLPLSLAVYYLANESAKEYVLLFVSLLFYAIGSVQYIVLFSISLFLTVLIGRTLHASKIPLLKKGLFLFGIVLSVGPLIFFKYAEQSNILLPLGISFYSFKAISYLADVYRDKAVLTDNPIHDALYLSFFAQIQSGPLTRYNDMAFAGCKKKLFIDGVTRFLIGFNKKILIADLLAKITTEIFNSPVESYSTAYAWLGSICYSLQLFYDFSGYSDMAIGISGMFGYRCMENFNYPYMTESVSKFWRRWHISLSEWFRDYIYIPMGGSRNQQKWKVYRNLFVVWFLTGLWHGTAWNYVAWGLGYFVIIAFERLSGFPDRFRTKTGKNLYRIVTLAFINFQWVMFRSRGFVNGVRYIKRMLILQSNKLADIRTMFLLKEYLFFIILGVGLCFPVVPWLRGKVLGGKTPDVSIVVYDVIVAVIVIAAFIWSLSFVVAGQNNPFAYANF